VVWSTAPVGRSIEDAVDKGQPTKEVTLKGDACGVVVVQHFDGVAVKDADDGAGEVGNGSEKAEQEQERAEIKGIYSSPPHESRPDNATHFR
jgi:hypothetical protein